MRDGRKLIEELREIITDRVDDLEQTSDEVIESLISRARAYGREESNSAADAESKEDARRSGRSRRRGRGSSRRSRRSRGGSGKRRYESVSDPEEREHRRIVRRARSRARRRIGFITHLGSYLGVLGVILLGTRSLRVVLIMGLLWGIGLFLHYFIAIAAPRLHERWVRDEVGARSPRAVASERRRVETRSRRSMEDLSASIAHEIRNPITAAKSLVQQMGEDPSSQDNLEYAEVALAELDRVERSISHLLRYARDEEPRFERVALESTARDAVEGMRERARSAGVEIRVEFDHEGFVRGDTEKLRRVFENLISNALDALAVDPIEDPCIQILGGENLAGNEVWVRVMDNGPGIPEQDRARIWSPFHSTKETGTGLGLALSRKTVEAHGGHMELEPASEHGAEFVISFPKDVDDTLYSDSESEDEPEASRNV